MLPLTKKRTKITSTCKSMLHLWEKNLKKIAKNNNYWKVRDRCHFASKHRDAVQVFIDSTRLMATSFSNRVDNLTEQIQKLKCKDCDYFLEYETTSRIIL